MYYLTPSDWLVEGDVRSGLLFIEFRSDLFRCACSMARATERQRKVASDRFDCVATATIKVWGMSKQYVRSLGTSEYAMCVACFRHNWSPFHLAVDLLVSWLLARIV